MQFQFGTDKTKIFTHMCTICLQDVIMLGEDKHNESWEKALKKCTTPSNGLKHLVTAHADNDSIKVLLNKKAREEDPQGALEAVPPEAIAGMFPQSNTVSKMVIKRSKKIMRELQARWLALNNIPHHYTQSPEFSAMFRVYDKTFVPIARETFMEELQNIFQRMIDGIKKLVDTNRIELRVGNWLAICHDMWNTITMDGALGSSIKLTTKRMETYTIAAILEKNNESHAAADVGEMMQMRYEERFGIDCVVDGGNIKSDTCKAASNVADVLEGKENDCEMHVVNLSMGYGLGVKENKKNSQGY